MGNIETTIKPPKEAVVDGGQSIAKEQYGSLPTGYEPAAVAKVIIARKLAPFYDGTEGFQIEELDDPDPSASSMQSLTTLRGGGHVRQKSQKKKKGRYWFGKSSHSQPVDLKWLMSVQVECPICFLNYPRNINFTNCCRQPICTLCFVNMRCPSNSSRTVSCPYCVSKPFAIIYQPPGHKSEQHCLFHDLIRRKIKPQTIPRPRVRYSADISQQSQVRSQRTRRNAELFDRGTWSTRATNSYNFPFGGDFYQYRAGASR